MRKIWNLNKYTGVLGAFNCQGGIQCPDSRRNKSTPKFLRAVTCLAGPKDVEWRNRRYPIPINGVKVFAVYMYQEKKLKLLKSSEYLEISLQPLDYEVLTVSPVKVLPTKLVQFAPIGLVNMLNSGGTIQSLVYNDDDSSIRVGVRGSGEMRVFATEKTVSCVINGVSIKFSYEDHMVTVHVPWPNSSKSSVIEFLF